MDSYFAVILQEGPSKDSKHLISEEFIRLSGMLAVFIASKHDEAIPITIRQIFVSAGHGKYPIDEIKQKELDILETISYRLNIKSVYQEAAILIKSLNKIYKKEFILPH